MLRLRAHRRSAARRVCAPVIAGAALLTAGCQSEPQAITALDRTSADQPAISVIGKDDGLEVRWWMTEAAGEALVDALGSELTGPVPLDDRSREILAANGFRVVALPIAALDRLPSQLRPIGSVQQQRLAQTGVWTDVARGATWDRPRLLTMHDGPLELPPGRLRLLARGWITPTPTSGGEIESVVAFELVPQHQDRLPAGSGEIVDLTLDEPDSTPQGQGIMFWRLALRGQLRSGEALVILAEDPFKRWSEGEEDLPPEPAAKHDEPTATPIGHVTRGRDQATEPVAEPQRPARAVASMAGPQIGPPSLATPTVGEALLAGGLSSEAQKAGRRRIRAIVALVPRTPENFRLLGGR